MESSSKYAEVSFIEISSAQAGQRIDNFLLVKLKGVPRSRIYRIIRKGEVRVNKKRVKAEYKLQTGDLIRIPPIRVSDRGTLPPPSTALAELLNASVLWEDESLIVINKPSGLPVHAGTGVKQGLIESMRFLRPDSQQIELVHRIDKGTSGCVLLAKNRKVLNALTLAFKERRITKVYQALVVGQWPKTLDTIAAAIEKKPARGGERKVEINENGMTARTDFRILQNFPSCTLIEARPLTGRTHQIRVHCSFAGHPIIGDDKYFGHDDRAVFPYIGIKRLCLHAAELTFIHPQTHTSLTIKAPMEPFFGAREALLERA